VYKQTLCIRKYTVMELGLINVKIQINSLYCGLALSKLHLPEKCVLMGIIRDNKVILASAEPTICCGDELLALAFNSAHLPALKAALKKTHPIYYSFNECLLNNSTYPVRSLFNSCYKDGFK
jgi:NhaP-type Na+/H+ and K+/H+ antiporter